MEVDRGVEARRRKEEAMLTMTARAHSIVRRVTAHPRLSTRSGLRIASAGTEGVPMQVRASAAPQPDDLVVESDGARLFLGPKAVTRLRGRVLDAVTERSGRVQFVLRGRS